MNKLKYYTYYLEKINGIIAIFLIIIILIHSIVGAYILLKLGYVNLNTLSWIGFYLCIIHAIMGIILTIPTIKSSYYSKKLYFKENSLFWIRRISGYGLLILLFLHYGLWGSYVNGNYVFFPFTAYSLIIELSFVLLFCIHLITNIQPLFLSFGIIKHKKIKKVSIWILIVLSIIFLLTTVTYYLGV